MPRQPGKAGIPLPELDPPMLLGDATATPLAVGVSVGQGVTIALAWIAVGAIAALALERRGHDLRSVIGLAAVLGPLFLPMAVTYVRDRDPHTRAIELVPTPEAPGRRAIVVLLGPSEAVADALPVLDSIDQLGSLTLAAVIDYDAAQRPEWDDQKDAARRRLRQAMALLGGREVGLVLVPGTVERGLPEITASPDDVIVLVGDSAARGAERLSGSAGVPVITAPPTNRH